MNLSKILNVILSYRKDFENSCECQKKKFYEIDLRYHRASRDWLKKCKTEKEKAEKEGRDPIYDIFEPPTVLSITEQYVAYLSAIFTNKYPMFSVVSKPEFQQEAEKLESELQKYDQFFQWKPEDIAALRDTVKYNVSFTLVEYVKPKIRDNLGYQVTAPSGISFKTVSPYQCIWDTEAPLHRFQSEGTYFETSEYVSYSRLNLLMDNLESLYRTKEYNKVFENYSSDLVHEWEVYSPLVSLNNLTNLTHSPSSHVDWDKEFEKYERLNSFDSSNTDTGNRVESLKGVKYSKVFFKATSKQVGKSEASSRLNNYKAIIVNDSKVIYLEELLMPVFNVVVGTGIVDNLKQTESVIEPVIYYQDIAAKLVKAKLSALKRSINDRGVYNPKYIDPDHINQSSSNAKIPLNRNVWNDPAALQRAYQPIPYDDTSTRNLLQESFAYSDTYANKASGINPFRQNPVRGNRSKAQFEVESGAGDNRMNLIALLLEGSRYSQLRFLIKNILLHNRPNENNIDWATLSDNLEFNITNGLQELGILEDTETLNILLQTAGQNPEFSPLALNALKQILHLRTNFIFDDYLFEPQQENENATREPETTGDDRLPEETQGGIS